MILGIVTAGDVERAGAAKAGIGLGARKSSQSDFGAALLDAIGVAPRDGATTALPSKSRPESRSISLPGRGGARVFEALREAIGGGASGAGSGVGLLLSIDSSPAISSVRPPSIDSRSPTGLSGSGVEMDGT